MNKKINDFDEIQREREREEIARLVPEVVLDPKTKRQIEARRKLLKDQLALLLAKENKGKLVMVKGKGK